MKNTMIAAKQQQKDKEKILNDKRIIVIVKSRPELEYVLAWSEDRGRKVSYFLRDNITLPCSVAVNYDPVTILTGHFCRYVGFKFISFHKFITKYV
jgi:hypothetical protein